ncbi:UNVERIFIED_ORG: hypothetical protein M2312_004766 [Rhizobium esperanzae]|nr:hypothetical protein [Rhizobium esperanzae]
MTLIAVFLVIKKAVENAALLDFEVRLEPTCLLKETNSHVVDFHPKLMPFRGWNNALRLRLTSPVNMDNSFIFHTFIHA